MVKTRVLFGTEQPPSDVEHVLVRHRRSTRDLKAVVHDITGSIFRGNGFYALECSRDEALRHAQDLAEEKGVPTLYIRDET
jgi:hypothetical protein